MRERERPRRPYGNLGEFLNKRFSLFQTWVKRHGWPWPCLACNGAGRIWDPSDRSASFLASLRKYTPCEACKGTGEGTRKACYEAYRKAINGWQAEAEEYDRLKALKREAIERLSYDEIEALRELGI
jgi:hypothetical protein